MSRRTISLDMIMDGLEDRDECVLLSDRGAGAKRIYRDADLDHPEAEPSCGNRYTQLEGEAMRAVRRLMPNQLETFRRILRNGSNRAESIWQMAKRGRDWNRAKQKYYRDRRELCEIGDIILYGAAYFACMFWWAIFDTRKKS